MLYEVITHTPRGTLYIAAPLGLGRRLVAPLIPEFHAKYPQITLRLRLSDRKLDLAAEGIDAAFVITSYSIHYTKLYDVGYLHRGFEKLMERRTFIQVFPIVCRVCVPEPDFNEYCYAAAVEDLAGIEVPEMAQWMRTLILEMGRFNSYMMSYNFV